MSTMERRMSDLELARADLARAEARNRENLDRYIEEGRLQRAADQHARDQAFAEDRKARAEWGARMDRGIAEDRQARAEAAARHDEDLAEDRARDAAFHASIERSIRDGRREFGHLSNKMGTLVEDLVAPSLPDVFLGLVGLPAIEASAQRVRRRHRRIPGRNREIDYLAVAGGFVLVNETKSALQPEQLQAFRTFLDEVRDFVPEAEGRAVIGSLASFSMDPSLVVAGERQGLLMLGLGSGLLEVLNSTGFVPRRF